MRINKVALLVGAVITTVLFAEVASHASEMDQSTKITFSAPIEIPGGILPAGTYLFTSPYPDNRNLVQISNADRTHVYATLQTNATERPDSTADTTLVVADGQDGMPDALRKWFYPGNAIGHDFVYPEQEEQQLVQSREETIVASGPAENGD